jgi:LmbE family N-acetylglucosaminyl deacetylase
MKRNLVRLAGMTAMLVTLTGCSVSRCLRRVRHFVVVAHQDDDIMVAPYPIWRGYLTRDRSVFVAVMSDGAGAPQGDSDEEKLLPAEMRRIRRREQLQVGKRGRYAGLLLGNWPSKVLCDPAEDQPTVELAALLNACLPRYVWTHSCWEEKKHVTHTRIFERTVDAILRLPPEHRPQKLYGGEVWNPLGWVSSEYKKRFDVTQGITLFRELLKIYESQVARNYLLGMIGRWFANATYEDPHSVQIARAVAHAADMSALIQDPPMPIEHYREEVLSASWSNPGFAILDGKMRRPGANGRSRSHEKV